MLRRSESAENRWGSHESTAMLRHDARPVDESRLRRDEEQPSLARERDHHEDAPARRGADMPAASHAVEKHPVHRARLIRGRPRTRRGDTQRMIPPAVMASDVAMSIIVRLAVRTFGSRMIWIPFETASMPV